MRTIPALLFGVSLAAASPLHAQVAPPAAPGGEELVDRVVAVVGDTVLLLTDVQEEIERLQASGRPLPSDPAERTRIAQQIVEQQVNQLILLQAARAAGTEVRDQEVTELVDEEVASIRQRFGSEAAMQAALAQSNMTLEQFRQMRTNEYRDRLLADRYLRSRIADGTRPSVSEEEIRAAFEAQGAALGARPANVSFRQIIIEPQPSDSARAEARRTAEQVLQELQAGGDFAVLARRYSDDPGSKEHGGDLGWFRRGRMVPAFENTVYALRPGQTSGIVETEFGFHIIRLEKARGAERQARHILITPELTEADQQRARERADSLANLARTGADFAGLARAHSAEKEQQLVERQPVDRLPPAYAPVGAANAGEVVGPFEMQEPTGTRWAVAKVTNRQESGTYTLDDLREQIRSRLQEQKLVEQLVADLRKTMYVSVNL